MPKRIQRKRTKGWRMPDGAVSVTRPGKWGNPFKVGAPHPGTGEPMTAQQAVDCYEVLIQSRDLSQLRGKNLACFCPLDKPCHADVLLMWANPKHIPEAKKKVGDR